MPGVKDLFILAQEGQCKQMVFDGISGVISRTLANWKMIHYVPRRSEASAPGEGGAGRGHLVRKDPPLGAAKSLTHRGLGKGSLASPSLWRGHRKENCPRALSGPLFSPSPPRPLVWVCWGVCTAVPGPQPVLYPRRPGWGGGRSLRTNDTGRSGNS